MKNYFTAIFALFMAINVMAQPQAFKYQTVVRDIEGEIVANQNVSFQMKILQGSPAGTEVYAETHSATTNLFGLANLVIGQGSVISGDFETIDWGSTDHFLEISFDIAGGTNYQLAGISQLMAVPYALYAKNSGDDTLWQSIGNNIYYNDGKVGIGTTDTNAYKFSVAVSADGGSERAIAHFRNNSNAVGSLCDLYISSGESGSTYLNYVAPSYIHQGGKYPSHSMLGNNGKGLVFRSGQDGQGRFAFEFRRETGSSYTYDEKVSITYDGRLGIGNITPSYNLDVTGDINFTGALRQNGSPISLTDIWSTNPNGIHFMEGNVGIGTNAPQSALDVMGQTMLRANTTIGSGNWVGLFFNGFGNDDQPEWLLASHNDSSFQFRRWDGVDFSEHYLKVKEGEFRFGAFDCPPLKYHFNGWVHISDSLKVGSNNLFVGSDGKVGIGTSQPTVKLEVLGGDIKIDGVLIGNGGNGPTATVLGYNAMSSDQIVSNSYLTAIGSNALYANTTGIRNTAVGGGSLQKNTTGSDNTAQGVWALVNCVEGNGNTAMGFDAMFELTEGSGNTSIGCFAGRHRTITNNGTFLGYNAYANVNNLSNVTGIGYDAHPTASNQVKIGNSSVTSIGGSVGWTVISDERFKVNLKEDVKGLDFILKLRPVTFNYAVNEIATFLSEDSYTDESGNTSIKTDPIDKMSRDAKEKIRYTGFLAQEVEEVALQAGYDFSGVDKPMNEESLYGIRYAEFVVPLVKAIQEQQAIIETLKARIEVLENR